MNGDADKASIQLVFPEGSRRIGFESYILGRKINHSEVSEDQVWSLPLLRLHGVKVENFSPSWRFMQLSPLGLEI